MLNLKSNLEKNGFVVYLEKNKEDALKRAVSFIKDGLSIGLGGSVSVAQIGLLDFLVRQKNITLFNQYEENISMQENIERRRKGLLGDLYITSCNAITRNGELVNADGSGNRVAAQIFGPKKVLLIVGKNKIVDTIEDGFSRIMEIAAPKNIERMNKKAIDLGKEPTYNLRNIAHKFAYINGDEQGRTTIIIVDEELGF
ncbi:MAG: lactate utilization protein [Sulfurospirillaceae bacterium]|nr:lactate utilization protein [Sulfurospirillaceae bacterium]